MRTFCPLVKSSIFTFATASEAGLCLNAMTAWRGSTYCPGTSASRSGWSIVVVDWRNSASTMGCFLPGQCCTSRWSWSPFSCGYQRGSCAMDLLKWRFPRKTWWSAWTVKQPKLPRWRPDKPVVSCRSFAQILSMHRTSILLAVDHGPFGPAVAGGLFSFCMHASVEKMALSS